VPPGFTISTGACRAYLATGVVPEGLFAEVEEHFRVLEARTDKRLGDSRDPLLLSVRSGGRFSMPGMMGTILEPHAGAAGRTPGAGRPRAARDPGAAIAEAAAQRVSEGGDPRPEIMVPLVGAIQELEAVRAEAEDVLATVYGAPEIPIGTMIEVSRAALTAGELAGAAEFFSFGTNDLRQMGWGFSRDDVEGSFFTRYLRLGIFAVSPSETVDAQGIGRLLRLAMQEGRAARPGPKLGVCGEHGGDPASVHFFHDGGLDYVSCSPYRIPIARLEAGRAAVRAATAVSDSR
jgi:phosphoenolpyruvate synthase/pyruvate phosphate dikinase